MSPPAATWRRAGVTLRAGAPLLMGTGFTSVLSHLAGSVDGEHSADISGLFNTITRAGGVIGSAVSGTLYLALAAAALAGIAIRAR